MEGIWIGVGGVWEWTGTIALALATNARYSYDLLATAPGGKHATGKSLHIEEIIVACF